MGVAARRQRERAARRRAILDGAARLFRDRAYADVRVEDIAAAAEVGKGTVYLYFPDKDAIVAELAAGPLGRLRAEAAATAALVAQGRVGAVQGLRRVLAGWTATHQDNPWLFRLLALDRPRLLAEDPAVGGEQRGLLAPLEDMVRAGRARGEVSAQAEPEVVSRGLWALFVGGLLLEHRGEVDPADIRREGIAVLMALVRGFCVGEAAAPPPAGGAPDRTAPGPGNKPQCTGG